MNIVHLTAHLGGGVGKALAGLIECSIKSKGNKHSIICLEELEKNQFADRLRRSGCEVLVDLPMCEIEYRLGKADIVQVEFWSHPALISTLSMLNFPPLRLLVWYHNSGLSFPSIPIGLIPKTQRFVLTSPCSLEEPEVARMNAVYPGRIDVVSSGGGLEALPMPRHEVPDKLRAGYIGSLNFSKLHPEFVAYLSQIGDSDFSLRLIGDPTNENVLGAQCGKIDRLDLLEFRGYREDIVSELRDLEVLIYLLNPCHYGTAENALLEAMAMGTVPIVLDNAAERAIIEHMQTGLIVKSPEDLAFAWALLTEQPDEYVRISNCASEHVRKNFTYSRSSEAMNGHYRSLMDEPKTALSLDDVFGRCPADWFRSFVRNPDVFSNDGTVSMDDQNFLLACMERRKGSIFHYRDHYPGDSLLQRWSQSIEGIQGV